MFQLLTMTEAHVASVTNRVEKHGDDDKPAVTLGLRITAANTLLDLIDPKIRLALYERVPGQDDLPGVEASTPVLRCNSFDRHKLATSHEGWTLAVDDGADETKPMVFGGCKVDKFSFEAKQGGSIELDLRVGTSDVDADKLGKLAMHNGGRIWITLTAPTPKPDAIDASSSAPDLPKTAADLFAESAAANDDADDTDGLAIYAEVDELIPEAGVAPGEVSVAPSRSRTARGRAATKAALAAGLAAQEAAP